MKEERGAAGEMVFGFDRSTDERSLAVFMKRISRPEMLNELIPRLDEKEIVAVIDLFTKLMKNHLSKSEYHLLFLADLD